MAFRDENKSDVMYKYRGAYTVYRLEQQLLQNINIRRIFREVLTALYLLLLCVIPDNNCNTVNTDSLRVCQHLCSFLDNCIFGENVIEIHSIETFLISVGRLVETSESSSS